MSHQNKIVPLHQVVPLSRARCIPVTELPAEHPLRKLTLNKPDAPQMYKKPKKVSAPPRSVSTSRTSAPRRLNGKMIVIFLFVGVIFMGLWLSGYFKSTL